MNDHPLSKKKQIPQINILAREAFNKLDELGLIDAPGDTVTARFNNWRHAQQAEACGKASLTDCTQRDYLPLRAHFNGLLGRDDKAFEDIIKSSPENSRADEDDTPEQRDQFIHCIEQEIKGSKFHLGYVVAIARSKFRKPGLKNLRILTSSQLKQLLITIKNRVRQTA